MKSRHNPFVRSAALAASIVLCLGQAASAGILTWDGSDTLTSGAQGGAGTWDASLLNWWNGSADVVWPGSGTDNDALFANTAGTVTLGSAITANDLTFNTTGYILSGAQTLTLNGTTPTITTATGVTTTIGNNTATVIAGSSGLTKTGAGTLILNGSAVNTFTSGLRVNRGTLTLDFANLASPTNLINSGNALTLGGGTLSLLGKNVAGTSAQTFASTTLNPGASIISMNKGASATSLTLSLGALSRTTPGSTVTFQPNTAWTTAVPTAEIVSITSATTPGGTVTLPTTGNTGYLGAGVFLGSTIPRYAQVRNTAGVYNLVAAPTSSSFVTSGGDANTVYSFTAAQTLSGPLTNYAVIGNISSAAAIALGANNYTLNGFLGISTGLTTISSASTGTVVVGAENELVVNLANTGGLTISAPIVNKSASNSNLTLSNSNGGAGVLTLSGANTYSGITTLNAGTLAITTDGANGAASSQLGAIPSSATAGKLVFNGGTLSITPTAGLTLASNRGILVNDGGGTMTNTAAQTVTTSGIIAGTGAMTFNLTSATGGFTIAGNNTFSGGATLSGLGTFFVSHNSGFGTGTLTLNGAQMRSSTGGVFTLANAVSIAANTTFTSVAGEQTLTFSGPAVLTGNRTLTSNVGTNVAGKSVIFSGGISEDVAGRGLTKAGTGTLTLSGASTYTGTTTVSAGRLALTKNTGLYNNNTGSWTTANITVASGATLALNVGSGATDFTSANIDTLAALGTSTTTGFANGSFLGLDTSAGDFTYASNLVNPNAGANALGVIKLGSSKLTLSGTANTYTGITMIGGGTLVAGSTSAFGDAGNDVYFMTTPSAGTSGTQLAGGNLELVTDSSVNAYDLNGTSSFASTLILSRANSGDGFTQNLGSWTAGNNVLNVTKGANWSMVGTPTVAFTGMNLGGGSAGNATLTPTDTNISITGAVNIGTGSAAKTLILDGNIAGNSISGNITNNINTLSLTKSGTSTWNLSGNNTYTGATAVNAGTLQAGSTTALSSSSAFSTADVATAVLDLNGNNNTIGSLAGGGATGGNVTLGAGTLTTGGNNTTTAYAGKISGASGGLIKAGSGVFTLSGTTNDYTGATAVNAGSLIVNSTLASSGVTVANLATLGGTGTIANLVTVNSGGTLSAATATTAGTLTLGALTLDAGSLLAYEFGGTSDLITVSNSGGLTIDGGILNLYAAGGASALTANGTYSLINYSGALGGALLNLTVGNSQAGKAYSLNDTGSVIELILGTATASTWTNGTSNGLWSDSGNWTGGVPNSLGALATFDIAGSSVAVDGAKTVGSIVFNNATGYTITGGGSDTITLDNGIAAGAISTVTGNHAINAPIILSSAANMTPAASTTLTLGGDISGSKGITFSGAGTTILAGTNTYTTTSVTAGKLQIGAGSSTGTLGSGAVTLSSGTTLEFNRTGSYSTANNITGPAATLTMTDGTITLSGTKSLSVLNLAGGTPTISGTNTITTLAATGGNSDVSGSTITTANVSSSGAVNFSNANTITTANVSGGTATFSGTNSLTTLNLSGGTAKGGSATGFGTTASLVLTGTGTLDLNGNNASFIGNIPTGVSTNTITDSAAGTGTSIVTFGQTSGTSVTTAAIISDGGTRKVGVSITNSNADIRFANANNTFSGGLTLLNNSVTGSRVVMNAAAFTGTPGALTSGNYGTGTITVGQAATDKAGIYINGSNITLANAVVANTGLGTDRVGTFRIDTTGNTFSGQLTAGTSDFTLATNGTGAVNLTGKITSTGSNGLKLLSSSLSSAGSLTVTLTNTAGTNDYAGNTTINDNAQSGRSYTLVLGANDQIPNGTGKGNVVINTNGTGVGTLRLQGFSDTINGLSGNGTVTTTVTGASLLTLGDGDTTSSFSGTISQTTGTVGIIKTGSGDQTFTNTSSYTGGTQIDAGKLILGHATDTLANSGAVNVNGGELALGTNTDTVGAVTLTSGSITGTGAGTLTGSSYDVRSGSVSAKLGGSSVALTKSTAGTVTLSGANSYTGGTTVSAGTLVLGDNSAAGTTGISLTGATAATLQINSGITIANNVTFSNSNASSAVTRQVAAATGLNTTDDYTVGTSGALKSNFAGGQDDTTAKILAGTNSGAAATTLTMKFSDTAPVGITNDAVRRSDVFSVNGTTGSDLYVLQLSTSTLAADSVLGYSHWNNLGLGDQW